MPWSTDFFHVSSIVTRHCCVSNPFQNPHWYLVKTYFVKKARHLCKNACRILINSAEIMEAEANRSVVPFMISLIFFIQKGVIRLFKTVETLMTLMKCKNYHCYHHISLLSLLIFIGISEFWEASFAFNFQIFLRFH